MIATWSASSKARVGTRHTDAIRFWGGMAVQRSQPCITRLDEPEPNPYWYRDQQVSDDLVRAVNAAWNGSERDGMMVGRLYRKLAHRPRPGAESARNEVIVRLTSQ